MAWFCHLSYMSLHLQLILRNYQDLAWPSARPVARCMRRASMA